MNILPTLTVNTYEIDAETFPIEVGRLQKGETPGRDLKFRYWCERPIIYRNQLMSMFKRIMEGQATARNNRVAKKEITEIVRNKRFTACLNIVYKQ